MFYLQAAPIEEIGNITPKKTSVKDLLKTFSRDDKDEGNAIAPKKPSVKEFIKSFSKDDKDDGNANWPPKTFTPVASVPLECNISNVKRMAMMFEDHAIVDDIDVQKLQSLGDRDIAEMQDNKTDDDQPDLDTDDSSGDKSKIKPDVSMEGFTEATDITTPIEMGVESALSKGVDFDTSYQISDLPDWSKHDIRMSTPETHHRLKSETLFDITDLDDLTDIEENIMQKDAAISFTSYSEKTLIEERQFEQDEDCSPRLVESKLRIREEKIDEKFERMSMSMSEGDTHEEGDEFGRLSTSVLSKEDEEQAASNFDKIIFDNYVEDKSEDWLTHESNPSPEKEMGSGEIFGAPDKEETNANQGKSRSKVDIE